MTHPEELLAAYVDGTLPEHERAEVHAHLSTCAPCREEVELARAGRAALASLEEEPVPFGVTGPVLAEAGRWFERRRAMLWRRVQWAAGSAAAAALVLVVALNLGNGAGELRKAAEGPGGEGAATAPAPQAALAGDAVPVALERQPDVTYDDAGLRSLARDAAVRVQDSTAQGVAPPDRVLDCLRASGAPLDDPRDALVRLIEARYVDEPAYIAVFLEGPGAGQPPDRAVVWVVATADCRNLAFVQQRL